MNSKIDNFRVKKILLIEDNKEISNNIKDYLELENFEIIQSFD
jgi:DNA-binding response OmpR family regulator